MAPADRICVYIQTGPADKPMACGIYRSSTKKTTIIRLFAKDQEKLTIYRLEENIKAIRKVIEYAVCNNIPIATTNFKNVLKITGLPIDHSIKYGVYDFNIIIPNAKTSNLSDSVEIIQKVLQILAQSKLQDWQRILADAAPVYQFLENRGVYVNSIKEKPQWSQMTFSGRSKTTSVNIQGFDGTLQLGNPAGGEKDIFVFFDWVAADLNVAARLSNDEVLKSTFSNSDPYTFLSQTLGMERDECKLSLLAAINKLDVDSPLVTEIYKDLGLWMRTAKAQLATTGKLSTILNRVFDIKTSRNGLAVLNGVLQGSIAHAMHIVVRRVWERFSSNFLVETHDSTCFTSPGAASTVESLIEGVVEIMSYPFVDIPGLDDFSFPVKVSIGNKYKQWRPIRIYRDNGVEDVRKAKTVAQEA